MDLKNKIKLKQFIANLEKIKGRHTELISVYVPAGYDIIKIIQHLAQEQGTAENIKDKTTKKNVIDSLERMIRHLRLYKKTPENGLAAFAGNSSEREGSANIEVWSIEPPEPLKFRLYRCNHEFVLDPLKDMLEHKEVYGLVVLDRREATIGLVRGTSITKITELTSGVPGKTKAGGQSQQRFARLREEAAHEFFKRISEVCNREFFNMQELKGIIIGGPGPTKEDFLNGDYLHADVKKKVIGTKDLSYSGEFGLNELVEKSHDLLEKEVIIKEKQIMQKFLELLGKDHKRVSYKINDIRKALEIGAVDILLLSESLEDKEISEFEQLAQKTGAKVEIISTETNEGIQLKNLGGIGAILRYAIS